MKYTFDDIDQRIIKTKLALSGAIFELMKKQTNIKVLDICKYASISPITYYHHFKNKKELLIYAVKQQLENKLPIPKKLKPVNIKQLVAYLLKTFSDFIRNNYEIINSSINVINKHGYENSYIQVLLNLSHYWICYEIKQLMNIDALTTNIWTDVITNIVFLTIIHQVMNKQNCEFIYIWKSLKNLIKCL